LIPIWFAGKQRKIVTLIASDVAFPDFDSDLLQECCETKQNAEQVLCATSLRQGLFAEADRSFYA